MPETDQALAEIIADLKSGKGVIVGGREQTREQVAQTLAALGPAIQTVVDESQAAFGGLASRVAGNIEPDFELQLYPPVTRISVSQLHPGLVTLAQLIDSPTSNTAWNRYRVQARAMMPKGFSRQEKAENARYIADHERAHAQVYAQNGVPFRVGIDVTPYGVGGHVAAEMPYETIPPHVSAAVNLAPRHPSAVDIRNAAAALLEHQGPLEELFLILEAPGYDLFVEELGEAVDVARHTLHIGDGTDPDNPLFIDERNRDRLFGGIADLLKNL